MCLLIGETYGLDTTALRFFCVYGSRQALSNPYTGVWAIFSSRLLNGNPPLIYEDGNQTRDFVHVYDVCQAVILSLEKKQARYEIFNVGTGKPTSIKYLAEALAKEINPKISPKITLFLIKLLTYFYFQTFIHFYHMLCISDIFFFNT